MRINRLLLTALLAVLSIPGAPLLSDNFNAENGGTGVLNYNTLANWDVVKGSVDLIGNGYFDFYPGNGLFLDLDGSSIDSGGIRSKTLFALNPGTYNLVFDLGGSQRGDTNTIQVKLGTAFTENFTLPSSAPLATVMRTISVNSAESGYLSFTSLDARDNVGLILDNVALTANIPEPATMVMMGAGLLGLAAWGRRKLTR